MGGPDRRARRASTIAGKELRPRAEPLYRRIFVALQAKIRNGDFRDGLYLPSENELSELFGVSRITAARALNDLAEAGLVIREQGRGTRVRVMSGGAVTRRSIGGKSTDAGTNPYYKTSNDRSAEHFKLVDLEIVRAPKDVSMALGIRSGRKIVRVARIYLGDRPFAYITAYLRPGLGGNWSQEQFRQMSIARLVEQTGLSVSRTEEEISATNAKSDLARHLDVARGAPLLRIMRTSFDEDGQAIEYMVAYYPSERYRYAVTSNFPKRKA